MRDVGLSLVGGSLLYVAMAACSGRPAGVAGTGSHAGAGGGGGGALQATGGGSGNGQGSGILDSGIFDALTDPVSSASADVSNGSRLKAKFRSGEDGSREYLPGQWYDTQRSEACAFAVAGDGATRCLPAGVEFRYYADAACNTPMAIIESTCAMPTYATKTVGGACGLDPSAVHVYALGAVLTPMMMYAKSGTQCIGLGQVSGTDYTYITVGAEIPASTFVAATVGHD
jgi:hypothetical protein